MKGYDVYKRALSLLGYVGYDDDAALSESLLRRALDLINQILADLKLDELEYISDEIIASSEKTQALCYGTAMLMAISEGDAQKNALLAEIYNSKRSAALSEVSKVEDKLIKVSNGVD